MTRTSLVFEQVDVGTLHSLLHNKRAEFPVLQEGWILSVMLQVCEGLHFLHRGALVMRALSSHSVILTKLTVAKLSCLGFMVSSSETSCVNPPHYMELPPSLHRWAAPEVIKQRACREEADIYSVCALILELYTDDEPWGTLDPLKIKQAMDSGQALSVNSVPLPYYELVSAGLQLEPQNRTCSLQTLTNTLQQDIKRLGMDEQSRVNISAYPEPDPECGVQTRTQQTTVKEQVHIAVCRALRPVTTQVSTEEESDEVPLNKQLDRRPQCEPDRVSDACSEGEPMLPHPHTLILPLLSESDSSSDDEEPDSVTDDEEPDADMETVEQLAGLMQPKINQQISTISVNLKVSRELLQEAHRSLDMVENHCQLVHRNAPPCIHDNTSSSSSSFLSMSSEDPCGVTAAVGPPSEWYTFSPYGRDDWTENLVFQLLSGDFKLLSEEELSLWLSHYPADQMQCEQRWSLPGLSTGEADQCSEQLSQYVSALDDSDLNIMSDRTQQVHCGRPHKLLTSRSEEDADVSVEVCRPASTGNLLVDTQNTKYESFPKHCEETVTDAAVGQTQHAANTNMTCSDVALLAEMSSITCSPAQLQQKLCSPPVNTRALPYYSTPYSPDTHRRVKIMEADLPQSPACSALHSANLKSFNTAREDSIQGFNSFQPPPFSMHSPCSSQTFITACLQSDTTSHTAIAHSTEEEEYRSEEEEEGERAGGAEAEQREEDGTSLSRPLVHLEDEEQADEEEGKSSQTAKEGRDEEENMAERSEEEEHVEQGCDEEECVDEYTDEDERVVGGSDENECEGGSDEDEHVEEECVDKYTDEKERDEEYSDEEESVAGSSDEEEHVEEEWVEKGSDEDERVVGGSDEDEAGLCHPQREVSSGAEEEGSEDEADDRRKVTSGLFDQETGGATGLLPGSQKKKKEHLMESQQSLLEDTTRAHSTLDDVLQEFECEEERESPGAQRDGKILCALFEGPTGDHDEHSARQRHSQQQ
ncbi:uncharacterized protein LOC132988745 [Labrus mixtus]|uniref:uncharacterized protein LOC132988745 n=1 Tax=Labrus mixtus TaxID=508554 RepID=UPI0029C0BB95|nr:uncharacterized protein LOC132988745 [Labrus mixtus]